MLTDYCDIRVIGYRCIELFYLHINACHYRTLITEYLVNSIQHRINYKVLP